MVGKLGVAGDLAAGKRDVMKHQNSTFLKLRDFWASDPVLLLIGYISILNIQCVLLHIFTAREQTLGLQTLISTLAMHTRRKFVL